MEVSHVADKKVHDLEENFRKRAKSKVPGKAYLGFSKHTKEIQNKRILVLI